MALQILVGSLPTTTSSIRKVPVAGREGMKGCALLASNSTKHRKDCSQEAKTDRYLRNSSTLGLRKSLDYDTPTLNAANRG